MKRTLYGLITLTFLLTLPLSALAMSHEKMEDKKGMEHGMEHKSMKEMDHGSMKGMDHGKMMQEEGVIMLGQKVEDGVKAMGHLKDVGEEMAKMNMKETHHFMVKFMDTKTGDPIEEGLVAVKITTPSGETSKAKKLIGMEGHFGADVTLEEKGKYQFEVGTKLKDGEKRTYEFTHMVK